MALDTVRTDASNYIVYLAHLISFGKHDRWYSLFGDTDGTLAMQTTEMGVTVIVVIVLM